MIPILFETTETAFTSNGIGRLTEAISCEVEEERNGVYELTLEYPMTGRLYGEISEGRFIYSRHSDALDAQPFRIYKITKPMDDIVTVHAHHRSYDLNHVIVRPFTAGSAAEAMQRISLNTLNACPFTFWTDKSVTADFSLKVPASIRGILGGAEGSILDVYGKGEYEWDNATVKLHLNRGTDTGVTIMYGKNLTDINEESTAENLVSAVAPFWKDAEGENVVVLPEGILTLAGASSENALPLDLSDKFDEAPTVEDLRSKANTWLTNNGKLEPESNIRLSFAQLWQTEEYKSYALLQRVNLCDTVTVIYPALGVKAKTKVIRVVYDALLERYTKMELGEPKSTLSGTLARQEETVRQIVRSFQYPTISQVNAAVNTATKLITGGMGGHVVIGTNANGQPNEILIMDTDDIDTAVNVIRMNANGIGFSTTGYNGPFNTAWTIDGAFVADFITSGTLDANLIRAGIIMDKAGKNYWNLETGEISIDASAIGEDYVTSSQLEVTKNGIMTSVSQTYVTKGNAVSSVATQYYSSTSPDSPQGGSWQDTVPDWQDGRYIFEKTVTMTADGQSEEKIVCISGATGATGERGPGIYKVTTEPSSFETETGGFTPTYRIALATVKIQSGVSDVFVGDVIEYDVYHYPVGYVDASYVYLGARTSIKGADGLPATAYTLIVSHAAIAKSASGTFAPASITLTAKSQTGTNAYANYSGRFKIEVYNGSSWSTKYTSSSNENTKSYTIPSGTTQVRCSLYLAGGTTTLLDQQTIPVVSDGAAGGDAYTIILDNESHTFAGGTSAAIAGTATVNVYAYKGATAIAPTVTKANISGLPTGMSVQSVTNDSTNKKSTIVFAVTTSMVTRSGMVTIPVVVDGKTFSKTFSYALALKGDTGVSISSVTNYYLATSASSGVTTSTSGWTTTVQTMDATKQYLWNYEVVTGSNNSTLNTTTPVIIGRYGQNGGKGDTGRGITSITEHYQVSSSNSTAPTTWSDTMVNTTATNKYLWNYETITYTDGTTEDSTKRVIGTHGEKGDTGASIASVTNYYLASASSSGVTTSTSGWATNPTASAATMTSTKQYLWNYEVIKDSNNTTITTTSPVIIGRYGQNGGTGSAGKGITGITEYYLATSASSGVTTSTSGWTTAVQSTTATNKYLWNYEVISYTSGNPYTSDPRIIGTYGNKGDKGDKGDDGVGVTRITKTGTSGTVDTYTIKYTDNTSTTFTVTNGTNGTNGTSAEWFYGTALTHTSGTATATISGAKVGDMYLNTATSNVYKCTAKNVWTYAGNIADGVLDNIEVGGRNLLLNTDDLTKWNIEDGLTVEWDSGVGMYKIIDTTHNSSRWGIYQDIPCGPNTTYTCSVEGLNGDTSLALGLQSYAGSASWSGSKVYSSNTKSRISATITTGSDHTVIRVYLNHSPTSINQYYYAHRPKLEKGNIATDWTPAPEDVDASIATASDTVATLEARTTSALDTITNEAAKKYKQYDTALGDIQTTFNSKVEQTSESFLVQFNGLLQSLKTLSNETTEKFAEYSKYFRFTAEGLEIGEESNALTLVLDNDKISFRRNGVEFSYWDGSDNSFHVGDIIVDVNQVARFGSFGLVPLEGGDLAWKWLGGST